MPNAVSHQTSACPFMIYKSNLSISFSLYRDVCIPSAFKSEQLMPKLFHFTATADEVIFYDLLGFRSLQRWLFQETTQAPPYQGTTPALMYKGTQP